MIKKGAMCFSDAVSALVQHLRILPLCNLLILYRGFNMFLIETRITLFGFSYAWGYDEDIIKLDWSCKIQERKY